jgi:hypothetical protein
MHQTSNGGAGDEAKEPQNDQYQTNCSKHVVWSFWVMYSINMIVIAFSSKTINQKNLKAI